MKRVWWCFCLLLMVSAASSEAIYCESKQRLSEGWEFVREDISCFADVLEIGRMSNMSSKPQWQKVCLPHCYNSADALDPDVAYYKGVAWYRSVLSVENPYEQGRTILEFEGAGQKVEIGRAHV